MIGHSGVNVQPAVVEDEELEEGTVLEEILALESRQSTVTATLIPVQKVGQVISYFYFDCKITFLLISLLLFRFHLHLLLCE